MTVSVVTTSNLGTDFDTAGAQVAGKINVSAALKASLVSPTALLAAFAAFTPTQIAELQAIIGTSGSGSGSGSTTVPGLMTLDMSNGLSPFLM